MRIGPSQYDALRARARESFIDRMALHARSFQPLLCEPLSDDEVRAGAAGLVARAEALGFATRGQARLFVEMGLIYGFRFDTDPQIPWVAEILGDAERPFPELKARALRARANAHVAAVFGTNGEHALSARRRLRGETDWPTPSDDTLEPYLLLTLEQLHPEKAAHVGEAPLRALIARAREVAAAWDMPGPRAVGLMAILMNQFGHGCDEDPFYPWIRRGLADERIADGAQRAERLERRARAWMEVVLRRADAGEFG